MQREPENYRSYSDTRPDIVAVGCGTAMKLLLLELKLLSSIPSDPADTIARGRHVAFANTLPGISEKVHGLIQRGNPGDGRFNYTTGEGYVPATPGAYEKAKMCGCEIALLLFETFGGFGPEMVELLA